MSATLKSQGFNTVPICELVYSAEDIEKVIDKIADKYLLKKDNILIANGCDEALSVIINSYLDEEDEIYQLLCSFDDVDFDRYFVY